jgi:hypothetical protein
MSRGLGHVQRTILALIEADPHGAWTVEDICRRAYPDGPVEKKHRVAALRALDKMKLPGTWGLWVGQRVGQPRFLVDGCDDESQMRMSFRQSGSGWRDGFEGWKKRSSDVRRAMARAADARKYRDASSPVEKLDILIARERAESHRLGRSIH